MTTEFEGECASPSPSVGDRGPHGRYDAVGGVAHEQFDAGSSGGGDRPEPVRPFGSQQDLDIPASGHCEMPVLGALQLVAYFTPEATTCPDAGWRGA